MGYVKDMILKSQQEDFLEYHNFKGKKDKIMKVKVKESK
jgi:hypothetical protein